MTLTPDQIVAANKANLETLVGLTNKAFAGVEQLIELNLAAAKAALADSQSQAQAALSVKDAQQLLALQASMFQPLAEKAVTYNRHLYDIASSTGADFSKAFEGKVAEAQQAFQNLVDNAAKNAFLAALSTRFWNACWASATLPSKALLKSAPVLEAMSYRWRL